ncbi:putative endo-polygalacturonase [Helianthus anomalus]
MFIYSDGIQISNLTLIDSPLWNVHPIYSSNIIIQGITILAPVRSWNTDGINPSNIITCISPMSAVISLGSEMSGDIQDVRAEDIVVINSESGVRIRTGVGRGGFMKDIYVKGFTMHTMKWAFWMTANYGSHPIGLGGFVACRALSQRNSYLVQVVPTSQMPFKIGLNE